MSLFGSMKTAVSGMNAQANRLSGVADNIANVSTTSYKRVSVAFSSMVIPSISGTYSSGGVETTIRRAVSQQGDISYTTSGYDLSIQGDGFFVVQGPDKTPCLTRAGDFMPDAQGNLVNAAGYMLMGYSFDAGSPAVVVNGFSGLVAINVQPSGYVAVPSTSGSLHGNLNSDAAIVTSPLPANNLASSTYSQKTSLAAFDNLGNKVLYDFYFAKTAAGEWQVTAFRNDEAATSGSPFPYASGPIATGMMQFGPDGRLTSGDSLSLVDGIRTIEMDLSGFAQLATQFSAGGKIDGQAPSQVDSVTIDRDGTVSARFQDGSLRPLYRIPLASVASPDQLTLLSGNIYMANGRSGVTVVGFPQSGWLGSILSGALEGSNVDLAHELTEMIEAQRVYTANSKSFQTSAELMDVLVNMAR